MAKCSVVNCNNGVENGGKMCLDCSEKFNSEKYYIHCCHDCASIVFFTRRLSKNIDRVQYVSVCKDCITKTTLPPPEIED